MPILNYSLTLDKGVKLPDEKKDDTPYWLLLIPFLL